MTTATDFDLVVSGKVVLTDRILDDGWVAVRDGKIAAIGIGGIDKAPGARERHDFKGCLVLPGAIDSQTHSKSQKDQEDFIWSTRSAAAGGVTTIVDIIRAGVALLIAAMSAKGKSTIFNINQIDRGYQNIDGRLNAIGAEIIRKQ